MGEAGHARPVTKARGLIGFCSQINMELLEGFEQAWDMIGFPL